MKLNFSKKILLISVIVFVMVFVLDIIFVNLLLGKITSINNKIKQLDISSRERERELNLKDSIASTNSERTELLGYFIGASNAETVKFTKYLEDLARQYNVIGKKTLDSESASELTSSEIITSIRYRFSVSGRWLDVFGFLRAVENLPKIISLNSVSLSINSQVLTIQNLKNNNKEWTADLDFSVMKLKN